MSQDFCQPGDGSCYANGVQVPCLCSGNCGHGYFCHTPEDSCIDGSDCPADKGACIFDVTSKAWVCAAYEMPT